MKNNIQPEIRFPSFSERWEQKKIGDFYTFKNGLNKEKEFFGSGTPIVNFTDVFHNRRIFFEQLKGKVQLSTKEIQNYNVKQGDIFFTRTSETINEIGLPSVMINDAIDTVFSGFVLRGRAIGEDPLTLDFKSYVFFTASFREEMKKKSSMTTRALTSGTAIKEMFFNFPENKEEQMKIGKFFRDLDETISLHQQELDALKQTKQGFLQKMFPKNEDTVPEIRLKGFTDEWTLCELKNVATFINGRAYKQNELLDSGKYKVLRVGNFYTNTSWYYSDLELGEKYYANYGDLLYTWSASFGPHIWKGDKVIYHYHIWRVDLKDGFDKHFIVQLFEYDKAKIMSDKNGSTMVHITKKGMEEKIVRIPSYDEQIKIGEFFRQLDEVIELKEKELEALKETKKGFLQKMFV